MSGAPPKELCCPITQELLVDPVVAEDGHSYERRAIEQWFSAGSSSSAATATATATGPAPGSNVGAIVRSPVTNEELPASRRLVPNHALRKVVDQHRTALGWELLRLCHAAPGGDATSLDAVANAASIMNALECGADVNVRDAADGSTCLHVLVSRGRTDLVRRLVAHGADASVSNERGETPVALAKRRRCEDDVVRLLEDAAERARAKRVEDEQARVREREQFRRTQERRRAEAHALNNSARYGSQGVPLVAGTGFFPSLFGLQFQGSLEPARAHVGGGGASGSASAAASASATLMAVSGSSSSSSSSSSSPSRRLLASVAEWARQAIVGRDVAVVPEDARQVQLLSRVLLGLGSSVLVFLLLL